MYGIQIGVVMSVDRREETGKLLLRIDVWGVLYLLPWNTPRKDVCLLAIPCYELGKLPYWRHPSQKSVGMLSGKKIEPCLHHLP